MAIVVFVLSLCFAAMGLISLYFGYDLGGTERGVAYTISGSVALSAAGLLVGLSTITARLTALVKLLRERPVVEAPLSGMSAPPAYIETPRPFVPVQRPEAPEPEASHPVPPTVTTPLAPVLAGGAAAVATAATMDLVFRKDPETPKPEPEPALAPFATPEPAFDFEQALARELARPQPEISPLPVVAEPVHSELAAELPEPALWDVKPEPVVAEPEPKTPEPVDHHHDHVEIPDLDSKTHHKPEIEPETAENSPVADWMSASETDLRGDDAKSPATPASAELPDDVFDDAFEHKPAPVEMVKAEAEPIEPHVEPHHSEPAHVEEPHVETPIAAELHPQSSVLHSPEPEPEHVAQPEPLKPIPMPAATAEDPGRKVIGSYSVGSNNYTMYADGSVEAHTETGLYRFASLDELRHFIEKGTTTSVE